jgi:hypothetical protein
MTEMRIGDQMVRYDRAATEAVGEMVTAGEQNCNAPDSHHFEFFFTSVAPHAPAFRGGPRLTIEFTTHVKWVLPEGWPNCHRHPI